MKKLSLLMFAILILACATEKPVVEQPVIEEPEPVIEEPPPVVIIDEPSHHPLIADGTVKHGQVNVDPELLNENGFHFQFTEPFNRYWASLYTTTDEYLDWEVTLAGDPARRDSVWIRLIREDDDLEYDTEYKLVMSFHDSDCDKTEIVIQFRTKPQRPVVGGPAPVIQERIPAVAVGERFRIDITLPVIAAGDVADGDDMTSILNRLMQEESNLILMKISIGIRLTSGSMRVHPSVGYLAVSSKMTWAGVYR